MYVYHVPLLISQFASSHRSQHFPRDGPNITTLAELHLAGKKSIQKIQADLRGTIPVIVRSIWGPQSERIIEAVQQHRQVATHLIRRWETAEHRLIAVANSLTIASPNGKKILAVGIPLAAAHLFKSDADCYSGVAYTSSPLSPPHRSGTKLGGELSLVQVEAGLRNLLTTLRDELLLISRGMYLFCLFVPLLVTAPAYILLGNEGYRKAWLDLLLGTMKRAGPAFIKWGQWAATRPDLFSPEICSTLTKLQMKAPEHDYATTAIAIEAAFGAPIDVLFSQFDTAPIASGSIAQVHKAVLSAQGAKLATATKPLSRSAKKKREARNAAAAAAMKGGLIPLPIRAMGSQNNTKKITWSTSAHEMSQDDQSVLIAGSGDPLAFKEGCTVAVKVRHPGVEGLMERDFALMQRAAAALSFLPIIGEVGPHLQESLMQFGAPLREQLDLRTEAAHLARFGANFKWWGGVRFPRPAASPLVAEDVLVESFEQGDTINNYIGADTPHNRRLAGIGLGSYLKMLLRDNFIHADLHPGNILVRLEAPVEGGFVDRMCKAIGWEFKIPRLVFLDVGMIARLSGDDQQNLVRFFKNLTAMDGAGVADAIAAFKTPDTVLSPEAIAAFKADMAARFAELDPDTIRMKTQEVIADVMDTIRKHGVHIKGVVSSVVITSMVLEGWSTALDPNIRIIDTLKEILPGRMAVRVEKALERRLSCPGLAVVS